MCCLDDVMSSAFRFSVAIKYADTFNNRWYSFNLQELFTIDGEELIAQVSASTSINLHGFTFLSLLSLSSHSIFSS